MDDIEIEKRLKRLNDIEIFVNDTEKDVLFVLQSLGWTVQHIKNEVKKRTECPYDPSHLIGPSKLEEHMKVCNARRKQFDSCDERFPNNCSTNSSATVVIDADICESIIKNAAQKDPYFKSILPDSCNKRSVPLSHNEMIMSFTQDERRAIYDYVISQTKKTEESKIFSQSEKIGTETGSSKSHLEELALLRDMKRRRTKYKVSTKAKSYTEIMREVIDNQMTSHCEWINSKNYETKNRLYIGNNDKIDVKRSKQKKKDKYSYHDYKEKHPKKHKSKHKHKKDKEKKNQKYD